MSDIFLPRTYSSGQRLRCVFCSFCLFIQSKTKNGTHLNRCQTLSGIELAKHSSLHLAQHSRWQLFTSDYSLFFSLLEAAAGGETGSSGISISHALKGEYTHIWY